jgi:uncharacterized protein YqeY
MNLFERVSEDIISAMKLQEKEKLEALRGIKAQLLLVRTSVGGKEEISDEEGMKTLQKMVKQRHDSAEIYKRQNRNDLYEKEIKEIAFIEEYLPKQLTDDELKTIIIKIISNTAASTIKDLGKVMGFASKELAGKADGKRISEIARGLLS